MEPWVHIMHESCDRRMHIAQGPTQERVSFWLPIGGEAAEGGEPESEIHGQRHIIHAYMNTRPERSEEEDL
jgi:hypothetical protein